MHTAVVVLSILQGTWQGKLAAWVTEDPFLYALHTYILYVAPACGLLVSTVPVTPTLT